MAKGETDGMQTFDQALYAAVRAGMISQQDALLYADSANEVRLMMKLDGNEPGPDKDKPELTYDDAGLGSGKGFFT